MAVLQLRALPRFGTPLALSLGKIARASRRWPAAALQRAFHSYPKSARGLLSDSVRLRVQMAGLLFSID